MKQFKNISKIVRHFIFNKNLITHFDGHLSLLKVLKPFKDAGLISNRTSFIYLFSYIAQFLNTRQKLETLCYNYSFLKKNFSDDKLKQVFNEGITCFEEKSEEDTYKVILKSSHIFEFEGSQFLVFTMNDIALFTLSFTFAPGSVFGMNSENLIYVSALKGTKNEFEKFSKATKYFRENIPSVILIKVLESIAQTLNIGTIAGISARNQLSFAPGFNDQNFLSNYDEFWQNLGLTENNGSYHVQLPMVYKDLSLIKQKYRNRTIKKRKVLDDILAAGLEMFGKQVATPLKRQATAGQPALNKISPVAQQEKLRLTNNLLTIPEKRIFAEPEFSAELNNSPMLAH